MLNEVALEVLCHITRHELEELRAKSRFLRDLIDHNSHALPLRSIYAVSISPQNYVSIQLVEDDHGFLNVLVGEENIEDIFHRINNSYIRRFELSFDQRALRFLTYMRDNAGRLQCRVQILNVGFVEHEPPAIDYGLLDFVAQTLRPQISENVMLALADDYALLFERATLRVTVKHLMYFMLRSAPAPGCIIRALFNVDCLETCGIVTGIDPSEWIRTFVKMFETAEPGSKVVKSVALICEHCDELAPLSNAAGPLGRPRSTAVPAPSSKFMAKYFRSKKISEAKADRFAFANTKLGKRLDVYKWMLVEETAGLATLKHCALLLTIVDV
ncbi:hypothetical protein AAVH_23224 [Aphelenchoides avenae]|nr:hypothetical protein AAVH_23224 [Aphelenchus avenae]